MTFSRVTGTCLNSSQVQSLPAGRGGYGRHHWQSPLIDRLIRKRKINVSDITGKWEAYLIETVDRPFPGVKKALVIAGSDKRGTIFGIYEISKQIGVSPWHWWADVPVPKNDELYVLPGRQVSGGTFGKIPGYLPQ